MIYREFQHKKYEQSNRSQRQVEIREGYKEVYQKEVWATHGKFWDQEGRESDM